MLSVLLVLILGYAAGVPSTYTAGFPTDAAFAIQFMSHVNATRKAGCICDGKRMPAVGSVQWHEKLEISAILHARQMLRYRFFEHYSKGGMDVGQRASAVGYSWKTIGENLARGQKTIPEVIDAWKMSPEHCKVLMNPKFREMGAAHVGQYWVLHLGVRKSEGETR